MRLTIFALIAYFLFSSYALATSKVVFLNIKGPIGPAMQSYFEYGLQEATEQGADAIILMMDTPGGLETSMRGINNLILSSPIPVISYVAPTGARAMSAGTFIMYASHLAYMSEGTTMGAATPIDLGTSGLLESKTLSAKQQKTMQDAIAYMKSLAELRGRNVTFAVNAVVKASAITATDAKKMTVINGIANDLQAVLKDANGKTVDINGTMQELKFDNPTIEFVKPGLRFDLLNWITDPNIAYLLLLLGIYAIVIELSHPGFILPGVLGAISIILALYAFQLMPLNYAGLSLLLMGTACMIAEVFFSTVGALGIAGLIAFVAGSFMLFDTNQPEYRVAWSVIVIMAIISLAFFLGLLTYVINAQRRKVVTGREGIINKEGIVISNEDGKLLVKIMGEQWNATSTTTLLPGTLVKVVGVDGINLKVEKNQSI